MSRRDDFSWWTVFRRVVDVTLVGAAVVSAAALYAKAEELESESQTLRHENRRLRQQQRRDQDDNEEKKGLGPRSECLMCVDAEVETALVPCGHACLCRSCATRIRNKCPVCRAHVQSVQTIFL